MCLNNFYAAIICFICSFVVTNEGANAIEFCQKYPEVIIYIFTASILAALGQICIFLLVSQFGALVCSVTTTTRKFFTIMASVILYGHHLAVRQWLGVALVFTGLFSNVLYHHFYVRKSKTK